MSSRLRWASMVGFMVLLALVVASCAPAAAPTPEVIVETVVVVETVEVPVEVGCPNRGDQRLSRLSSAYQPHSLRSPSGHH